MIWRRRGGEPDGIVSGSPFAHLELRQSICQNAVAEFRFPLRFSKAISFLPRFVIGAFRLSSLGFLDTFDLLDSSLAALPEKFLQLALVSFVSVLACDLRLQKSAIA